MFNNQWFIAGVAALTVVPVGLAALAKWRAAAELARLRAVHKAYTLRQMALTERRRVW